MARPAPEQLGKRYTSRGRVQGVGFRYYAETAGTRLGMTGWVRNRDDGAVEVYAAGTSEQHAELAGLLWGGPRFAEVRTVEVEEAAIVNCAGFQIRH